MHIEIELLFIKNIIFCYFFVAFFCGSSTNYHLNKLVANFCNLLSNTTRVSIASSCNAVPYMTQN